MFKKATNFFVRLVQKYLPDPFLFALILTLVVFGLSMLTTKQGFIPMLNHWNNGFWELLEFSMQMSLILVTGHTLANAPLIKRGLENLTKLARTPAQAIIAVTLISAIACWINWGFGLVIGTLYARQLAKKIKSVDYRLLIASAYSGFLVWHAGLSGSIPLKLASGGEDLAIVTKGAVTTAIATNQTIFSNFNLIICGLILVTLPLINWAMHPSKDEIISIDPKLLKEEEQVQPSKKNMTPADKMVNSPILSISIGIMGMSYILYYLISYGFSLNLNTVNFVFLFLGIILHGTPGRFLNVVSIAVKGTAGIIIQFPFYAGIMGMMLGSNADGLSFAGVISNWFVNVSNTTTFPLFTFLSAVCG